MNCSQKYNCILINPPSSHFSNSRPANSGPDGADGAAKGGLHNFLSAIINNLPTSAKAGTGGLKGLSS